MVNLSLECSRENGLLDDRNDCRVEEWLIGLDPELQEQ
jgi:hypothetical protein